MARTEKLVFDKFSVVIDAENLRFDDATLSIYIQKEGSYYDNYGYYLSLAERNLQNKESQYEKMYCDRFIESKESGSSDKLAEAKAKANPDIISLKEDIFNARYAVNSLKNHLKSWDKNHDNAQSLGHMLRKQMDRLNGDIYGTHGSSIDDDISKIIVSFDTKVEKETGFETDS